MTLLDRINDKTARLAVLGLGYVGLPLAIEMAKQGYCVTGIDIDSEKINSLQRGVSYILDVKADDVKETIKQGKFFPATEFSAILKADAVSICVPTPLNKTREPDLSFINAAVDEIKKYMHKDLLIVLESTTYPGTTEELVRGEIEPLGYKVGEDFFVAFSPERVDPANQSYQTFNTPKVMGGITPKCLELAVALYGKVIKKLVPVSSTKVAEMVKLLENTFRSVNIALVNEMALLCNRMEVDIWEVIDAASTKPFGFMPFYPGPGIGGHCIPLDPAYLSWKAKTYDFYHRFIELASDINGNMPRYVINRIAETLNTQKKCLNGSRILILGMAYKKDVDDLRESPALEMYYLLEDMGAIIDFNDDLVKTFKNKSGQLISGKELGPEMLEQYDLVVLATDHSYYDYNMIAEKAKLVFDTRNGFKQPNSGSVVKL
ncbi:MAG: nucleotide sugar dehydrogenase [Acidobacteriota bacterium]